VLGTEGGSLVQLRGHGEYAACITHWLVHSLDTSSRNDDRLSNVLYRNS
jgi:hypothetical protein